MSETNERWFEQACQYPPATGSEFVARAWRHIVDQVIASLDETGQPAQDASEQRGPLHRADRHPLQFKQAQALNHPVRIGVLSIFTRDTARSLAVEDLLADLTVEDPETFGEFNVRQIAYHRARLRDADLLPARCQ